MGGLNFYAYNLSNLSDYLTRRELLLRQYLELTNKLISIPLDFQANTKNPLFVEIQNSYLFEDPLTWGGVIVRSTYLSSLEFFKYKLLLGGYFKNNNSNSL